MPKQFLDYQYIDDKFVPFHYVLEFYSNELNWDKRVYHFDVIAPIESFEYSEINDQLITIPVYLSELIINPDYPSRLGINLYSIKKRLKFDLHDPSVIEQFILYATDIEMVLNEIPKNRTMNLLMNV
ncbi:hypothetical protein [Bacillus sp. JJ722]|uniref:hypothetical protein n=1 Tax=Bacillus sp. JJ722 TaxID=3122973 RepID=UPI002FFF5A4B